MFQDRFNLASADRNLLVEEVPAGPAPHAFGGPFVGAWRNYIKTVFKKGFMYKLSCRPSAHFYVAENKTLAGKEDRAYDGEALGRKLAVVFFRRRAWWTVQKGQPGDPWHAPRAPHPCRAPTDSWRH